MITFSICCRHRLLQHTVGAEGVSLEFRHISSYLLWYAVHWPSATHLLHLTILCIGYFAARHHDNQVGIRAQCLVTKWPFDAYFRRLFPDDFTIRTHAVSSSATVPPTVSVLFREETPGRSISNSASLLPRQPVQSHHFGERNELSGNYSNPLVVPKISSHMSCSGRCWTISSTLKMDVAFTWSKSFWVPKIRKEDDFC